MTSLSRIDLDENQLTGSLPVQLGQMEKLKSLRLRNNNLTGSMPLELGQLTQLEVLSLSGNNLTGCVPRSLASADVDVELPFCQGSRAEALGDPDSDVVSQCSNGVVVPDPESNPGLVRDCVALVEAREVLSERGLGWRTSNLISEWRGVVVAGSPERVQDCLCPMRDWMGRSRLPSGVWRS